MYARSRRVRGLGYRTVSEMLETMQERDRFDIFPEFSKVVHILTVIPATSCSAELYISVTEISLKKFKNSNIKVEILGIHEDYVTTTIFTSMLLNGLLVLVAPNFPNQKKCQRKN